MYKLVAFLLFAGILFPLYSLEDRCSHDGDDDGHYNQDYEVDDYEDNSITEDDFIVENKIYRWYILPSGKRVLKCRNIFYDGMMRASFGHWDIAVNFSCHDYHDRYFVFCRDCRVYYCSHRHHGTHHHHNFRFHRYHNIYFSHNHWEHHMPWRPWIIVLNRCHWVMNPYGWHWKHSKHCWHWYPGKHGKKVFYTKQWQHHGFQRKNNISVVKLKKLSVSHISTPHKKKIITHTSSSPSKVIKKKKLYKHTPYKETGANSSIHRKKLYGSYKNHTVNTIKKKPYSAHRRVSLKPNDIKKRRKIKKRIHPAVIVEKKK